MAKHHTREDSRDKLHIAVHGFRFATLRPSDAKHAMEDRRFDDIEDAMQFYAAKRMSTTTVITRNKTDFAKVADTGTEFLRPEEFLERNTERA